MFGMRRRDFLALLSGAAAWPIAAWAQQDERIRRIGVLLSGGGANDPDVQANVAAFRQVLQQMGWTDGRNVRIDYRSPAGNADDTRKYAAELVALAPTSSCPRALRNWGRCCRRRAPCRSYS